MQFPLIEYHKSTLKQTLFTELNRKEEEET